jgi:uncharacterized phosphosugar-binding protein
MFLGYFVSTSTAAVINYKSLYIKHLIEITHQWKRALPKIKKSAHYAAEKIIAGGNLYVAGPQKNFPIEAYVRAGGLMLARPYNKNIILTNKDVILAATDNGRLPDTFFSMMKKTDKDGCNIILFCSSLNQPLPKNHFITLLFPGKKILSNNTIAPDLSSVSNIIGMWTWTGEFASACVKKGKMPNFYESYGLPGGIKRDEALKNKPFDIHSNVTSSDVKNPGYKYLTIVANSLSSILKQKTEFQKAAEIIQNAHKTGHKILVFYNGHMFPGEIINKQTPKWITINPRYGIYNIEPSAIESLSSKDVVIILEYQYFPKKFISDIYSHNAYCILTCSQNPPTWFLKRTKNIYINPFWPLTDAVVSIPNYDIKILPISGIMQSAIYWQLIGLL